MIIDIIIGWGFAGILAALMLGHVLSRISKSYPPAGTNSRMREHLGAAYKPAQPHARVIEPEDEIEMLRRTRV